MYASYGGLGPNVRFIYQDEDSDEGSDKYKEVKQAKELMKAIAYRNDSKVINTLKEMTTEQINGIILGEGGWCKFENEGEYGDTIGFSFGPLHMACLFKNTTAVTALLLKGAINVNQTVKERKDSRRFEGFDLHFDPNGTKFENAKYTYGKYEYGEYKSNLTPIMIAAVEKHTEAFTLLVHNDRVENILGLSGLLKCGKEDPDSEKNNLMLIELLNALTYSISQRTRMEKAAKISKLTKLPNVDALKDLSSNFGELLDNGEMCDFKIVCEGEEIPCHKLVLMSRSNVLKNMINNDMKESRENCMEITDLEPKFVKMLVKFLYTGEVASDELENNAMTFFEVADRYELNGLIKLCENELISTIDNENVLAIVMKADMYKAANLREACMKWIVKNQKSVVKPEGWRDNLKKFPNLLIDIMDAFTS